MNIPTKITVTRIAGIISLLIFLFVISLLPSFVSPLLGEYVNLIYLIALIVFVLASFTDYLDGHLARKWNQVTDLGKFLDPIADKMLVDSMLVFLIFPWSFAPSQNVYMPVFCVVIMIARDLIIDALRQIAATKEKVLAANIFGKLKTVLQMIAIPAVLLNGWPFAYFDSSWGKFRISYILVYLATFASLLSAVIYLKDNYKVLKEDNPFKNLVELCKSKNLSIGSVESMTGGGFAKAITSISGSSQVFKGSLVTYASELKTKLASVPSSLIDKEGVVSAAVAKEMAKGGAKALGVDICVSITGNAGPTTCKGCSEVGTFFVAVFFKGEIETFEFNEKGKRNEIRSAALSLMATTILKKIS